MQPGYDVEGCRAVCLSTSGKALQVRSDEWAAPLWIPLSQITEDSEIQGPGDEGTLSVSEWFATDRGWL